MIYIKKCHTHSVRNSTTSNESVEISRCINELQLRAVLGPTGLDSYAWYIWNFLSLYVIPMSAIVVFYAQIIQLMRRRQAMQIVAVCLIQR